MIKQNNDNNRKSAIVNSWFILFCEYSIKLVAIIANGKKVNTNKLFDLLADNTKIAIEIRNERISFLCDVCKFIGFDVTEKNEDRKNTKTRTAYIEKAIFW